MTLRVLRDVPTADKVNAIADISRRTEWQVSVEIMATDREPRGWSNAYLLSD